MKTLILMLLAFVCVNIVVAQPIEQKETPQEETPQEETTKKKKKKGSFWKKVKKGVESTTGLDVSDETLFVYPEIGQWKISLKSAIADSKSGELTVIFKVMPLFNEDRGTHITMKGVTDENNKNFTTTGSFSSANTVPFSRSNTYYMYNARAQKVTQGVYKDFQLQPIYIEKGIKSLKVIKFWMGGDFEARDIPITWSE